MKTPDFALVYDTETTGIPEWKEPSDSPQQPHLVQIAAAMVHLPTGRIAHAIDYTVRPDGWSIPAETAEVHGLTTEYAKDVGVSEAYATQQFLHLWRSQDSVLRVAHNERFDARIIRIAQHRLGADENALAAWKAGQANCTGLLAKPIMKMPPKGRFGYKMPKLAEAYEYFMGQPSERQAHTAMGDTLDCLEIYQAIRQAAQGDASTREHAAAL